MNLRENITNTHWSIWVIALAATLNFVIALVEGSSINLLACITCLVGLAGILHEME